MGGVCGQLEGADGIGTEKSGKDSGGLSGAGAHGAIEPMRPCSFFYFSFLLFCRKDGLLHIVRYFVLCYTQFKHSVHMGSSMNGRWTGWDNLNYIRHYRPVMTGGERYGRWPESGRRRRWEIIRRAEELSKTGDYALKEWTDAVQYITGCSWNFHDKEEAAGYLKSFFSCGS